VRSQPSGRKSFDVRQCELPGTTFSQDDVAMISDADRAGMVVGNVFPKYENKGMPIYEVVAMLRDEGLLYDEDKRAELIIWRERALKAEALLLSYDQG